MFGMFSQPGAGYFDPNAPIPRPGQPTSSPGLLAPPGAGMQSQWNQLNGRLLGDTYLPPDVATVDKGKGWYDVMYGDDRVGYLRPGGKNGRFINDTGWEMPQPGLPALPTQPAQPTQSSGGQQMQPQPFAANGAYGSQAMQLAGLLAPQQPRQQGPVGLLGGPKGGFRIPGGK